MSEVAYKDIPGFPGYRIGSDGSVWSKRSRKMSGRLNSDWHRLTLTTRKSGYITACFRAGSKNHVRYIHHLVLESFVGPRPDGMECCHGPDGASDNRLENLRWGTPEENDQDKLLHGRLLRGDRHPNTKISDREVDVIRFLADEGVPRILLAAALGVSRARIGDLASGRSRIAP